MKLRIFIDKIGKTQGMALRIIPPKKAKIIAVIKVTLIGLLSANCSSSVDNS